MNFIPFQSLFSLSSIAVTGLVGLGSLNFSPWIWRQWQMSIIHRSLTKRRVLALTYDDGPNGTLTPELLDLLERYRARATFFMLGQHAQQHPEIVDRVIQEGHQVGCHSDQHLNAWKVLPWRAIKDIELGYQHLGPWISRTAAFRPPYGKITLPTQRLVLRKGAKIWWWTIDSGDSNETLPAPETVTDKLREEGGGIVLMHDGALTGRSQERDAYTLAMTAALLNLAKAEGIKTVTIGEI
jgi:peptidoglycan/xylan/chitin deacetylase (PgdA/CDA1 family)